MRPWLRRLSLPEILCHTKSTSVSGTTLEVFNICKTSAVTSAKCSSADGVLAAALAAAAALPCFFPASKKAMLQPLWMCRSAADIAPAEPPLRLGHAATNAIDFV
jgi:hypothetical protein